MSGKGNVSATPRSRVAAEHPWVRWLAHYGLGLSGAGGLLPEVREPSLRPGLGDPRPPGLRS